MIKITVAKTDLETISFVNKKGNQDSFAKQHAYAHTIDLEGNPDFAPEKFEFIPERDSTGKQMPVKAGVYTLHPSAIYVDRDGKLACRLRLAPVPAAPVTPAR